MIPRARHTDSPTSHNAAAYAATGKAEQERQAIYYALQRIGPATGKEIAEFLGDSFVRVSRRISEVPGIRKTNESREKSMVWEIVEDVQ